MRQNKPNVPKRRGRPRKSQGETSTPQRQQLLTPEEQPPTPDEQPPIRRGRGRPPGSGRTPKQTPKPRPVNGGRPRGKPRKFYVYARHDREVARILEWKMRKPKTMGRRVGKAARSVFRLSGQWPWELLDGFKPKRWGIEIMENMRKLFRIVNKKMNETSREKTRETSRGEDLKNPYGDEFEVVRDFLRNLAEERDERSPHLEHADVEVACTHFRNHRYERNDELETTTIIPLTALVESDDENDLDVDGFEDGWEDDDNTATASQDEAAITARHRKRPRSSSESSQKSQKRARSTESDKAVDTQDMSHTATGPTLRSYTFADLIECPRWLEAKEQEELELINRSLEETRASIQANETSIAESVQARASTKERYKLLIAKCKEEMESIDNENRQASKKFSEENHIDVAKRARAFTDDMQSRTTRLGDCEKRIAEAEAELAAKLSKMEQQESDWNKEKGAHETEEKRLGTCKEESLERLNSLRVQIYVGELKSSGIAKLLANLEARGVSLAEECEKVIQADDTPALGKVGEVVSEVGC
ncbi:hypothetical protein NW762_006382 [Fusarium torreyae]|uniref:Uncharacterized protein n=1 Tax=Fusarium torreyae TaxID=1237075 RepID=A0A9W8S2H2_9HYPO|nr:hypothetical protein NW762_006382 [Fusarium torreyae]